MGTAHIDKLPPELLADVLERVVERHREERLEPSAPDSPLHLATISRGWRAIAFGSRRLWSAINYRITKATDADSASAGVQAWIARSGSLPLSVGIYTYDVTADSDDAINALLEVYYSCSSRWEDVYIGGEGDTFDSFNSLPDNFSLPVLKCARVDLTQEGSEGALRWLRPMMQASLPALRQLHLAVSAVEMALAFELGPIWEQLTHLTIRMDMVDEHVCDMLRSCKNLVECHITSAASMNIEPRCSTPFTLHALERLTYVWSHFDLFSIFLAHGVFGPLSAPVLKRFALCGPIWQRLSGIPFFRRSQPPLRELCLHHTDITQSDLIAVLEVLNATLESFSISFYADIMLEDPVGDTLIERLDPCLSSDSILLPRLRHLSVKQHACADWKRGAFADMIESRMYLRDDGQALPDQDRRTARLETVELRRDGHRRDNFGFTEDELRLQRLELEGYNVVVSVLNF